jgi:Short C-terminal domain
LIVQSLIGRYVVGHLVTTESVRPAAAATYGILTDLLRGAGWTAIIIAVVALGGIWLSGPRPRATVARHALAPYLRRAEVAYGGLVIGYLLLLWWRPTPQVGFPLTVVIWFALALLGLEALRRQTAREFPDAEPKDLSGALRSLFARLEARRGTDSAASELERLAELRREGLLDDAEFTTAKAKLLGLPLRTGSP